MLDYANVYNYSCEQLATYVYIIIALLTVYTAMYIANYVYKVVLIHYVANCRQFCSLLATKSSLPRLMLGTMKLYATAAAVT